MSENILNRSKAFYDRLRYRLRLFKYYEQENNTFSLTSILVNLIVLNLAIFIVSYLWFIQRTRRPLVSLILTIVITTLLDTALYLRRKKIHAKKRLQKRRAIALKYLNDKLKELNDEEFILDLIKLLYKLPGVSDVKSRNNFLESTLHGRKIAIGYYNDRFDQGVPYARLSEFIDSAVSEGYNEAIYLTTGVYDKYAEELSRKRSIIKVHLLDHKDLLELLEECGMLPEEQVIDSLIDKEITRRNNFKEVKNNIIDPKRIRTYLGYSVLFMVLSGVLPSFTIYYMVISAIFLLLAIISYFNGKYQTETKGEASFIEELKADKSSVGSPQG